MLRLFPTLVRQPPHCGQGLHFLTLSATATVTTVGPQPGWSVWAPVRSGSRLCLLKGKQGEGSDLEGGHTVRLPAQPQEVSCHQLATNCLFERSPAALAGCPAIRREGGGGGLMKCKAPEELKVVLGEGLHVAQAVARQQSLC